MHTARVRRTTWRARRFHTLLGQAHIVAVANNVLLRLHNLYPDFRHEHDVENGDSGGSSKDLLNQRGTRVVMVERNSHGDVILSTSRVTGSVGSGRGVMQ